MVPIAQSNKFFNRMFMLFFTRMWPAHSCGEGVQEEVTLYTVYGDAGTMASVVGFTMLTV